MTDRRSVLGLTALALALRLAWVLAVDRDGLAVNDTLFYHLTASGLASGDGYAWFGEPTSRWPPVYPFLLGGLYAVVGSDPLAGEVLNAVVGALAVPLAYVCGARLWGRREGLFAAALLAVFPGQIFFTDVLLAETLYTTLLLGVLALALVVPRDRALAVVAVGVAIGIATETRAEGLLLLLIPIAVWWRPRPRQLALLAAGVALVVVPWTARNAVEMDAFVPISTNGSQTLWSGHNDGAYGGPSYVGEGAREIEPGFSPREQELEDSRRLRREALEWAVTHPFEEVLLVPRKLAWLIRGDSTILYGWVQPAAPGKADAFTDNVAIPLGNLADLFFYALLAGTLLMAFAGPHRRVLWVLLGAGLVMYGFVLYGNYRYRVPLEPIMLLVVAPGAVGILGRRWTSRHSASA